MAIGETSEFRHLDCLVGDGPAVTKTLALNLVNELLKAINAEFVLHGHKGGLRTAKGDDWVPEVADAEGALASGVCTRLEPEEVHVGAVVVSGHGLQISDSLRVARVNFQEGNDAEVLLRAEVLQLLRHAMVMVVRLVRAVVDAAVELGVRRGVARLINVGARLLWYPGEHLRILNVLVPQGGAESLEVVFRATTSVRKGTLVALAVASFEILDSGKLGDAESAGQASVGISVNFSDTDFVSESLSSGLLGRHHELAVVAPGGAELDNPDFVTAVNCVVEGVVIKSDHIAVNEVSRQV